MTQHYGLSPSASSRWLKCPASLTQPPGDDVSSAAAEEGTLAHEAANDWLTKGIEPTDPEVRANVAHFVEHCDAIRQVAVEWIAEETLIDPEIEVTVERGPDGPVVLKHGGTMDFAALSVCESVA